MALRLSRGLWAGLGVWHCACRECGVLRMCCVGGVYSVRRNYRVYEVCFVLCGVCGACSICIVFVILSLFCNGVSEFNIFYVVCRISSREFISSGRVMLGGFGLEHILALELASA